jgi:uncharacterized protein (TIGR00369 family)
VSLVGVVERCRHHQDFNPLCEAIPYAKFLGITVSEEAGEFIARLAYRPRNIGNPALPALHGGVVGAFLETTAIIELLWAHETPSVPKIINITIDYLRPAGPVTTYARGTITKRGRRVANVSVEAWQEERARPVAVGHCHFLLDLAL